MRTDVPHGARIWNYWLGGKDNFPADRAVGDAVRDAYPAVAEYALKSRRFLVRAVRHLAGEAGITQFLDVGTGLPTMQNTHEVAQALQPTARVVYVDNDPMVLAHARALLANTTAEGTTTYLDADYNHPDLIIDGARAALDFDRPIAVLFMGVFGYLDDPDDAHAVVRRVMAAVPSGSYMALWDATATTEEARIAAKAQADAGSPYATRSVEELRGWFDGLDLVEPGLVPITLWRPDPAEVGRPEAIEAYGAVARKP
ncbi:SAM-dependent methyltransferase [Pseudonocardia sp. S2-4]|uniref:SAM-dependent methyltransferase n=1 Tax=Pseudonocardia humida TaxID=2800819 RepID=A0ABT0ZY55_9PSEU|nr:SAM-dependent methyltransferase [Pseudonocardia humida]